MRGRFLMLARPLEWSFGLALALREAGALLAFFIRGAHCFIIDVRSHVDGCGAAFAERAV